MLEQPDATREMFEDEIDLGDIHAVVRFAVEPCGSTETHQHLYQNVCVACREQNPRRRDEWVSPAYVIDSTDPGDQQRFQFALEESKKHVRAHEIIGGWARGL